MTDDITKPFVRLAPGVQCPQCKREMKTSDISMSFGTELYRLVLYCADCKLEILRFHNDDDFDDALPF